MLNWLRRLFGPSIQQKVSAPQLPVHVMPTTGFWLQVEGEDLAQGDFLRDCLVPEFHPEFGFGDADEEVSVAKADLIVVTQSCDLENRKIAFVALCRIFSLPEFEEINPRFAKKGQWEEVRKGRQEGLHMLASPTDPNDNRKAMVADFRQIFSLPFTYLSKHAGASGQRWRLRSPYLEHFSQAFARFFMRVGLPSAIPPFR